MKYKKIIFAIILVIILPILLNGCIPDDGSYTTGSPAGFFAGIWHGIIVWITFFIGLFTKGEYTIYEAINTGWSYNLGFLLGVSSGIGGVTIGGGNIGSRKH